MAARAIWKGVILLGNNKIPVKLYSAMQDRGVHFRLLHAKDHVPVRQIMVNPETREIVPREATLRGYETEDGDIVILDEQELESLEPEPSRDMEILKFLPDKAIDHRWYDRPYYLGPDGHPEAYAGLIMSLRETGKEGLVRWVMRKKEYYGALRLRNSVPMLITLRYTEQVVLLKGLNPPESRELQKKEFDMAEQLISTLEDEFDPDLYENEYRERVMDLIETKAKGGKVELEEFEPEKPSKDLQKALEASLKEAKKRKSA